MDTIQSFASLYLVHVGKLQAKRHSDHCDLKWSSAKVADPICIRTTTSAWDMITMNFGMITDGTVACRHKTAWTTARTKNMPSSTTLLLNDLTWHKITPHLNKFGFEYISHVRVAFPAASESVEGRAVLPPPPELAGAEIFNSHSLFQDFEITKFCRKLSSNFDTTS